MNKDKQHDEHCRLISLKPKLIGLDGVVLSTKEAHILKKGIVYQEPDGLMFDPSTHTLYEWEYKCNDTHSQRVHAEEQLFKRYDALKQLFPDWHITKLYIHDNYKVSVVQ